MIAEQAAHLHVFQRSPQFTVPARHHTVDRAVLAEIRSDYDAIWAKAKWSLSGFPWQHNGRSALEATPGEVRETFEELWEQGGFRFVFGSYRDLLTDIRAADLAADFVRQKIRATVSDPDTVAKLMPAHHPFGGRRPAADHRHPLLRDLQPRRRDARRPAGDTDRGGDPAGHSDHDREVELDVLVLANGFDAVTGPFTRIDITGRDGLALRDVWADGPSTYLGLAVAGFPNMFTITGPGATFGNLPVSIEHHVEWIAACIEDTLRRDLAMVEAQQRWADHVRAQAERIVAGPSGSWYDGANIPGKSRRPLSFFGSFGLYRRTCEDVAANGYEGFDRHPSV